MPNNFFKKLVKKNNPYFIAEIGVNHENSIEIAEKIIKQAKVYRIKINRKFLNKNKNTS